MACEYDNVYLTGVYIYNDYQCLYHAMSFMFQQVYKCFLLWFRDSNETTTKE